jgi:hypothetical protein
MGLDGPSAAPGMAEFHFHPVQSLQNERPDTLMSLNEEQRQKVASWVAEGLKLSEIQHRLASELGIRLTYMDVRLLVDDLKLTPKDPEPSNPVGTIAGANPPAGSSGKLAGTAGGMTASAATGAPSGAGGVSVEVDQLARPGAIVSGKVTFSDGEQADWSLDQTGRLGVIAKQQGYKPSAADVQQFQLALEREMAKLGF